MAPDVPFALLAAVQLLSTAAFLGLAAVAILPGSRGRGAPVVAAGAVVLAVGSALAGALAGHAQSGTLAWLVVAGLAGVACGFALGLEPAGVVGPAGRADPVVLVPRGTGPVDDGGDPPSASGAGGGGDALPGAHGTGNSSTDPSTWALAPLAASLPPALAAAVAGVVAAGAAWRARAPGRGALAAGLALTGLAELWAPGARTGTAAALTVLALRGAGALGVTTGLAVLARRSLLAQLAGAMLTGVLAMAIGAAAIIGTVVARQVTRDQAQQVAAAATAERHDLLAAADASRSYAQVIGGCGARAATCASGLTRLVSDDSFSALVTAGGRVHLLAQTGPALDPAAIADLGVQPAVQEALTSTIPGYSSAELVLLRGRRDVLVCLGVSAAASGSGETSRRPEEVAVYGSLVDRARLVGDAQRTTFAETLVAIPEGTVVASSLPAAQARRVAATVASPARLARLVASPSALTGAVQTATVSAGEATAATLVLTSGGTPIALLVVSAPAALVVHAQQTVLDLLFGGLVLLVVAVGLLSLAFGRRLVGPVRRLTAAAAAVSRGDLTVSAAVTTPDEIGALSRTFDAMTASLAVAGARLRSTAQEQSALRVRLQTVVDSLADAVVVTDPSGVVTSVNATARAWLGDGTLGRRVTELLGAEPEPGPALLVRPGGADIPVSVVISALPDGAGYVIALRDTTAERQVERMKTEFLSNVSHELRTPLTPIRGYADLLASRPDLPPERVGAFATVIRESGQRLERIVNLLVDVAALEAGRVSVEVREVSAATFVAERLAFWRPRAGERAGDLRRSVAGGLAVLQTDPVWLAKAFDELVDNALKFSAPGRPVVFGASATAGAVELWVRDSGVGVDPGDPALFADFAQADGSATRTQEGMGLGLAFVRRVCAVLGVRLVVRRATPAGARFALVVPTVAPAAGPKDAGDARRPQTASGAQTSRRPQTASGAQTARRPQTALPAETARRPQTALRAEKVRPTRTADGTPGPVRGAASLADGDGAPALTSPPADTPPDTPADTPADTPPDAPAPTSPSGRLVRSQIGDGVPVRTVRATRAQPGPSAP